MSPEEPRPVGSDSTRHEETEGGDTKPAGSPAHDTAEEYRRYKQAEREQARRLERYERTHSTDTTRGDDDV